MHCGASIAHSKFLITSAHCVDSDHYDISKMSVLLGSEDIQVHSVLKKNLTKVWKTWTGPLQGGTAWSRGPKSALSKILKNREHCH